MKTAQKQITVYVCETCGKKDDTYPRCCTECGKHFCWGCADQFTNEYTHSMHFSDSEDGRYCVDCEAKLTAKPDKLFAAYSAVKALRETSKAYYASLESRDKALQKQITKLREERESL